MRSFNCTCGNAIFFENTECIVCRRALGFLPDLVTMSALEPAGDGWRAQGTDWIKCYNYADERSVALSLNELQRMTGRPDEVSLFAVAAAEGADEIELASRIEAATNDLSAYSTRELMTAMDMRLSYFRQLATILATIALVVASLLAATIVTIGVRERFGEIATLRAIGVSTRRLQLGILVEGLALTITGAVLGLPLGIWMAGRLDRILLGFPGIPARVSFFVLDPLPVGAAILAMIAVGATAVGILPGLRATRMPLGTSLREEAD